MKMVTKPSVRRTARSGSNGKKPTRLKFPQARYLTRGERLAIEGYKNFLLKQLPNQVERLVLYGSKARGDSTTESDVDVLVVIHGDPQLKYKIESPDFDLLMKYGAMLQPLWMNVEQTKHWTPLLDKIWKDGVVLWQRRGASKWVHPELEGKNADAEKAEAVETRMILAREKLQVARDLLAQNHFNDTISKAYYAMFYASKAMLLASGVDPHKHQGVTSMVGERIVHVGLSDPKYGTIIKQYMNLRIEADYEPAFRATCEQAEESIYVAEDFIEEAGRVLERIQRREKKP